MNITEDMKKVVQKIQKLYALANSPNEHEAAIAAAKAQELILKFDILEEVLTEDVGLPINNENYRGVEVLETERLEGWNLIILNAVADAFYCKVLKIGHRYYLVGSLIDTEVGVFTYFYLSEITKRFSEEYVENPPDGKKRNIRKTSLLHSYKLGIATSIEKTLKKLKKSNEEDNIPKVKNEYSIELFQNNKLARIDEFIKQQLGEVDLKPIKRKSDYNVEAFKDGLEDGKDINVAPGGGLNGKEIPKLPEKKEA